ncbi:hypothetical protein K505DRAFT_335813 [Melanomma pulvis-pyrius CBS 109.77]|uniref:Uncharacterized protein n=1 Tax=Melanomma pulvis-pyrius CBS 109.77 TaxID=1314802 RepID=A0A6A6XGY8_9PLEO|nr:hypothetical protein K505DRAFT_335813 [Melanomma pulvis-pyrius CBS 109.77]
MADAETPSRIPADDKRRTGAIEDIPDYEYICVPRALFDFTAENAILYESLEEVEVWDKYSAAADAPETKELLFLPADEHPEYKWVVMAKAAVLQVKYERRTTYCNPDSFDMYAYKDFHGYGIHELVENLLVDFDAAFLKKNNKGLEEMWVIMAAMGWWFCEGEVMNGIILDITEQISDTMNLIGAAFLESLNAIDLLGELKPNSKFRDLGLIMSLFLHWPDDLNKSYGFEGKYLAWRKFVVAYMKKAGLSADTGIFGTDKLIAKNDQNAEIGEPQPNRWAFASKLKTYKSRNGKMGGRKYDITQWTSEERAECAFDEEDILAHVPKEMLKNDGLVMGSG